MGRVIGVLRNLALPAAFTAFGYGVNKLSGQDDFKALTTSLAGVGGAYAAESLARKLLPWQLRRVNIPIRGKKIALSPAEIAASYIGGNLAYEGANYLDNVIRQPKEQDGRIHPALIALDEVLHPAYQISKAFLKG